VTPDAPTMRLYLRNTEPARICLPTGTAAVAFQFHPLDAAGSWRVDDLYVDPFKRH
jgi:hypothetical protein